MSAIDLIIFDCDGVLVDSEVIGNRVYADFLTSLGHPLTPAECSARYMGMSDASVVALFAEKGTPLPDTFIEDAHERERIALAHDLEAVSGVVETLQNLTVPYCLASSGTWNKINNSMATTGLDQFFNTNKFSFEQVENGKPAPDLFLFAAREMNAHPEQTVVIEDSGAGVRAGVAAGMTVIGFTGGSHIGDGHDTVLRDLGAHHVLDHMTGLSDLLSDITRATH